MIAKCPFILVPSSRKCLHEDRAQLIAGHFNRMQTLSNEFDLKKWGPHLSTLSPKLDARDPYYKNVQNIVSQAVALRRTYIGKDRKHF